ncbi:23S rRNA pseudouridine2604 synthase [Crenobacter luteus]|uniref:S4 domain-containing protein n=1 Tax=Crenobacter luteus TaxID=1452487 RepID=UPI00104FA3F8|nr:S4 domain-containing protein [Crenobacter luteus]TCP10594.1 23S rRNA pseudouridine2604 synthase [Crenobacter luteus]
MTDSPSTEIRLSKRVSELAGCSRREADELIELGLVKVDDAVVDVLGSRVRPGQRVEVLPRPGGARLERVTLLLNKPAGGDLAEPGLWALPARRDARDKSGVVFLRRHQQHLVQAGWLDDEAGGLAVLTQDEKLARQLGKHAADYEQEYLLALAAPLPDGALAALNATRELDGKALAAFRFSRQSDRQLRLVLRENRAGLVRRLAEAAGVEPVAIRRIRIGRLALGELAEGCWRYLCAYERF